MMSKLKTSNIELRRKVRELLSNYNFRSLILRSSNGATKIDRIPYTRLLLYGNSVLGDREITLGTATYSYRFFDVHSWGDWGDWGASCVLELVEHAHCVEAEDLPLDIPRHYSTEDVSELMMAPNHLIINPKNLHIPASNSLACEYGHNSHSGLLRAHGLASISTMRHTCMHCLRVAQGFELLVNSAYAKFEANPLYRRRNDQH